MREEEKPWHRLVMICPACGVSFQPEVLGLHVRLCPECEKKKSAYDRKFAGPLGSLAQGREKLSFAG